MAGQVLQGVDSFLGHSGSTTSGGFLDGWKDGGEIEIVLHPRAPIAAVWLHRWHRIGEDKEGKQKIYPMRFNSMEDERLLRKQHFRNDDGSREVPPVVCPFSLLLEWVREAVESDDINWTDEIFRFETPKDEVVLHAGGFTGLFQSRNLTDEQQVELRKAKISSDDRWRENARCSLSYVFCVVRYNAPEEGCAIAMEGKALGQKMQKALRDEKRKWEATKTPEKGDPFKHPFAIRWSYDDSKNFDDKYDVVTMPNEAMPITSEIQEVLDDDPPSIDKIIEPSNVALLRASFEEHWVHRIVPPWDALFAEAERTVKGTSAATAPDSFEHGADAKSDKKETQKSKPTGAKEAKPPAQPKPEAAADEEEIECDRCQAVMSVTEFVCRKCGAEYSPDGMLIEKKPDPPKEEPKRRSRSTAKEETKRAEPALEAEAPRRRRGG